VRVGPAAQRGKTIHERIDACFIRRINKPCELQLIFNFGIVLSGRYFSRDP